MAAGWAQAPANILDPATCGPPSGLYPRKLRREGENAIIRRALATVGERVAVPAPSTVANGGLVLVSWDYSNDVVADICGYSGSRFVS